jgi:ATP-dependent RNA helicase HelY
LWQLMQRVRGIEERANINPSPGIVPEFHSIALSWAGGMSLSGLLRRIDLAEGDILMILNQTIDLLQQVQAAVGQMLDARDVWEQLSPVLIEGYNPRTIQAQAQKRAEQLQAQRELLQRLRPLFSQAVAALLHGIIVQSRTVPSMVVRIGEQTLPLDAEEDRDPLDTEEDRDPQGLNDPQAFVGEV